MEVKIGVQQVQRELVLDTDANPDEVTAQLTEALGSSGVLSLTDTKGRRVVVPADKVAYVEFGSTVHGTVGFR
jgi:hypothetical protein